MKSIIIINSLAYSEKKLLNNILLQSMETIFFCYFASQLVIKHFII